MSTELIDTFILNGRRFEVLWKPSAAYLRADGHMWGGSLGDGLEPEDAAAMARVRAELMIVEERAREVLAIPLLYDPQPPPHMADIQEEYRKLVLVMDGKHFHVCTAPFNQNTYLCLGDGWHFIEIAPSADAALAVARAYLERLPPERRQPGAPDLPPDGEPAPGPAKAPFSLFKAFDTVMKVVAVGTALWVAYVFYAEATRPSHRDSAPMAESKR